MRQVRGFKERFHSKHSSFISDTCSRTINPYLLLFAILSTPNFFCSDLLKEQNFPQESGVTPV